MLGFRSSVLGTLVSGTVLATSLLLTGAKQYEIGSRGFGAAAVAGCTAPTAYETHDWQMFNGTCSGSACSSGGSITAVADAVGTDGLSVASGNAPTYALAAFGSTNAASFVSSSSQQLPQSSPFTVTSPISVWFTIKPSVVSAYQGVLVGPGGSFYIELRGDNHLGIAKSGTTTLAISNMTFAAATKYTIALTFDPATGNYTIWNVSGGSYVADTTGSAGAITFSAATDNVANGFNGSVMEMATFNGTWGTPALTAIAAYSQCKAGV